MFFRKPRSCTTSNQTLFIEFTTVDADGTNSDTTAEHAPG
jgi:hypothetical protein